MNRSDVIEVLKNSKKYSKLEYVHYNHNELIEYIVYHINEHEYKIEIYYDKRDNIIFCYDEYNSNVEKIKVLMVRKVLTEKTILSKFGKIIKNIKKLDLIICKRDEYVLKIKPAISTFLKNEYELDVIYNTTNFKITFPSSTKRIRKKWRNVPYDVLMEDSEKIIYDIYLFLKNDYFNCTMTFNYNVETNRLSIKSKLDRYKIYSKDVTKIVRCEKLKKLKNVSEEEYV